MQYNFKSPYVQYLRYYKSSIELGKGTWAALELKTAKAIKKLMQTHILDSHTPALGFLFVLALGIL